MISLNSAVSITNTLLSITLTLQFFEFLYLRHHMQDKGIWSLSIISPRFQALPKPLLNVFVALLAYPQVVALLVFRQLLVGINLFYPSVFLILLIFVCTMIFLLRWEGVFNGGSDYILHVILFGTILTFLFAETDLAEIGLVYIAIHSCYSYFKAGWVKIVQPLWRNGQALVPLITTSAYGTRPSPIFGHRLFSYVFAWLILAFEVLFPFSLLNEKLCLLFLTGGVIFHAINIYILGLNRFFWSWITTYPSLLYVAGRISFF